MAAESYRLGQPMLSCYPYRGLFFILSHSAHTELGVNGGYGHEGIKLPCGGHWLSFFFPLLGFNLLIVSSVDGDGRLRLCSYDTGTSHEHLE